jgi:hypothetical protein
MDLARHAAYPDVAAAAADVLLHLQGAIGSGSGLSLGSPDTRTRS